ncbi:hypothetical protein ASE75_10005 [Sphingomonas sp. Leaf17]|uniref:DedA family protein n=1 Tax=Sphingomonas sp. Leaf17 TaxID=1735683 RepID=UPI0006F73C26|nr:DedA family protein [Sphingomonas sp. Leaf17]KQM64306.1 hypothetical protein ASE75_10005 [Sphingomonas sp. Leaf17]
MTIETFVADYGLLAVVLGAGIEGETAVVIGGLMAHQGLLSLPLVMVAAAVGSFASDQIFFTIGRRFRQSAWVARLTARPAFARALTTLERHPRAFILGFRFLYGLRTISPVAVGTSHIPTATFVPLNALAAALWGMLFATIGYVFGEGFAELVGRVRLDRQTLLIVAASLLVIGLAIRGAMRWRSGR